MVWQDNETRAGARCSPAAAALAAALAIGPARADGRSTTLAAIRAFTGEAEVRRGRVKLDIPPLVENGNSVPVSVTVDSPMTAADHVKRIAVFNEKNPAAERRRCSTSVRAPAARVVATRIRLADFADRRRRSPSSATAASGRDTADVIVTLAGLCGGLSHGARPHQRADKPPSAAR